MKEKLTDNDFEKKILELLSKQLLSVSQIAKKLEIRRDVVAGYLEALKNQKKLEFHKVGRSNIYTVSRSKKINRFIFFISIFLLLTITPLTSATPVIASSNVFTGGVEGFFGSYGCVYDWKNTYCIFTFVPSLSTPSSRLNFPLSPNIFCNMQNYWFQKESW